MPLINKVSIAKDFQRGVSWWRNHDIAVRNWKSALICM